MMFMNRALTTDRRVAIILRQTLDRQHGCSARSSGAQLQMVRF